MIVVVRSHTNLRQRRKPEYLLIADADGRKPSAISYQREARLASNTSDLEARSDPTGSGP